MSINVTMRPRRLRTPATSGGESGTAVRRSGAKTSCTRSIGKPNSWPPIRAVTYSLKLWSAFEVMLYFCHAAWTTPVCSLSAAIRPWRSNFAT